MGFLSVTLTFVGYVLVYGATANRGRFATLPWLGVIADAYDIDQQQPSGPTVTPDGAPQTTFASSPAPTTAPAPAPASPLVPVRRRMTTT